MSDDVKVSPFPFAGRLVQSQSGWILLEVPNALLRGAFAALRAPGAELPRKDDQTLRAHISVMRPQELREAGIGRLDELGRTYAYALGELREAEPLGWEEMERVWFFAVHAPQLEKLRKSYGLPALPTRDGQELPFHLTIATRRRGVWRKDPTIKKQAVTGVLPPPPQLVAWLGSLAG